MTHRVKHKRRKPGTGKGWDLGPWSTQTFRTDSRGLATLRFSRTTDPDDWPTPNWIPMPDGARNTWWPW